MVGREWVAFSARCVNWHGPVRLVSVAEFTKDWIAHTALSANVHPPVFHIGIITEMLCKLNFYICSFSGSHLFWLAFIFSWKYQLGSKAQFCFTILKYEDNCFNGNSTWNQGMFYELHIQN